VCFKGYGPCFTGESYVEELSAYSEPYNGLNCCISYANKSGYNISEKGIVNMLSGEVDGFFTISELEVWEV
jgi:hypothetical protein